jgi:hypothetical protein
MEINNSTNARSDVMWYLDSGPINEDTNVESTETIATRQPWRSYWPPKCHSIMDIWIHSEFPEVLSWRFDRTQPFDRPWRNWTRSARAVEEQSAVSLGQQPVEMFGGRTGRTESALSYTVDIYSS